MPSAAADKIDDHAWKAVSKDKLITAVCVLLFDIQC